MFEQRHANIPDRTGYGARHFARLPDCGAARQLLEEVNAGVCPVALQAPRTPLILYGAGDLGRLAREYFAGLGYSIDLVIDRNAEALRDDPFWEGVPLAHPGDVDADIRRDAQLILCVSTMPYKPMEATLAADGWRDIIPFYDIAESQRDRHPLSNGWFAPSLDEAALADTAAVLDRWDDDLSRAHHLQFLAWRRLREEWTFDGAPITRDDRFFIPEVLRGVDRLNVFVDAGAHHGHVTQRIAALRPDFHAIVAIEPDEANAASFRAVRDALDPDAAARITLLPLVLDAQDRERPFHDGLGYASQWSSTGQRTLRGTPLDSLNLAPDFIKLHLEGSELDALCGARETIRRHRPVIAVTTYHNADGIWRTPAWLMEHCENYRFLMRLHGWCGTGAVVYAIPQEKASI